MKDRLRNLGQAAAAAALISTTGYVIHEQSVVEEKRIDAMCGGPARQDCDRIEETEFHPFSGSPSGGTIIRFVPKIQTTPIFDNKEGR